jgi:hypothetical protein
VSAQPRRPLATGVVVLTVLAIAHPARGQDPEEYPRTRRVEVSAGAGWTGRASLGDGSADLIRNQNPPSPYPIFTADSALNAAAGFESRVGYTVTKALVLEAGFSFSKPSLKTAVSGDVENAPPVMASDSVSQYTIEGGIVLHLTRWRLGRRGVPFVSGGLGYLRQLHEGRALVETGQVYSVGGGLKYVWVERSAGVVKGLGLRADARMLIRRGGIDLRSGSASHASPSVAASLFVHF